MFSVLVTVALCMHSESATAIHLAIAQNFPDPCLTYYGGSWNVFSTTSNGLNVPVATSYDFETWKVQDNVDAMPMLLAWIYARNPAVASPDVSMLVSFEARKRNMKHSPLLCPLHWSVVITDTALSTRQRSSTLTQVGAMFCTSLTAQIPVHRATLSHLCHRKSSYKRYRQSTERLC